MAPYTHTHTHTIYLHRLYYYYYMRLYYTYLFQVPSFYITRVGHHLELLSSFSPLCASRRRICALNAIRFIRFVITRRASDIYPRRKRFLFYFSTLLLLYLYIHDRDSLYTVRFQCFFYIIRFQRARFAAIRYIYVVSRRWRRKSRVINQRATIDAKIWGSNSCIYLRVLSKARDFYLNGHFLAKGKNRGDK